MKHRARPHSRPALHPGDYLTCEACGKRGYEHRGHARRVRAWMRRNEELELRDDQRLSVYRCEQTGLWHIGHDGRRGRPNLNDGRLRWIS